MTLDKAIQLLERYSSPDQVGTNKDYETALKLGINALKVVKEAGFPLEGETLE